MKKRTRYKLMAALITLAVAAAVVIVIPGESTPELKLRDFRFKVRGEKESFLPIMIAAVDDTSFELLKKRWPWPRDMFAEAVRILSEEGAEVIGFDFMLSEQDYEEENDRSLQAAFKRHGRVIIPVKIEARQTGSAVSIYAEEPLEGYALAAADAGCVNLNRNADERIRSLPQGISAGGKEYLPFARAVLSAYTGNSPERNLPDGRTKQLYINFIGGPGSFPLISIADILERNFPEGLFQGKIVLIGAAFAEAHDNFPIPFTGTKNERMYGVEIHAHAMHTLFTDSAPRPLGRGAAAVILILVISAALCIGFLLRPVFGLLGTISTAVLYVLTSILVFSSAGVFIPLFLILIAQGLCYLGSIMYRYFGEFREKKAVQSIFSRFVSPKVVEQILQSEDQVRLGGEVREVVLFFSDIRGFTGMSENLCPEKIVGLLNRYFEKMAEIIHEYDGTLNKFIGDAVMAFYGAPVPMEDAPVRAVSAALDMRAALAELNSRFRDEGIPELAVGMGMHIGDVLAGNIGSSRQMEYTVIGDAVNVCSRIESLTKNFRHDILISDDLYRRVSGFVEVETPEPVEVKGKSDLIQVHKVLRKI